MSSSTPGTNTLAVEVTNISSRGIWLLAHNEELFLPYESFPWFLDQPVKVILHVEEPSPGHYHWPDLDVDLTRDMILEPEKYPNVSSR